ncbi:U-box domain-containing protein 4-like [Phalaenopsis equestris]|uniref:U-box domain-containing protein 4-like n=1 Tax=Phalaenopsis equestris TaxID=78828 RepID=UPI0009E2D92D|nr:U-box domain-containing protein 4-like [Phalaenopsis equestris]
MDSGRLAAGEVSGMRAASGEALQAIVSRVRGEDRETRMDAAREIRQLTKTSARHRRHLAGAIEPLVAMLRDENLDCVEVAILALLNLAVKDERNKIKIVDAGALDPIITFLQSKNSNLQEYATAVLLTLSATSHNKPIISSCGAIPLLIDTLINGNPQAKIDAIMALYNLSTISSNLETILKSHTIPPLIAVLKTCNKSSKTADKCCAILESLLAYDEGRAALTAEQGGVLSLVEVLEEGSLHGREHAVGALLTMCESDRNRYREIILKEGAIPGLLELTVHGTPRSRIKAKELLHLLRKSPYQRSELEADALENIVCSIVSGMEGEDCAGKAKKMLAEMVQVSMEQSLRHLQQRALVCTSSEIPLKTCKSEVPLK